MAIEYTVIGRHIRAARKQKHLTQEDVADMIDMSPAHFGKVERGERPVNLQRLSQISCWTFPWKSSSKARLSRTMAVQCDLRQTGTTQIFWNPLKVFLKGARHRRCASCFACVRR